MELMCIKHRHENGCMWPFEGYSPVLVVDVRHTRWVNSFSLFIYLSLSCITIFNFVHATIHFAINRKILLSLSCTSIVPYKQILHIGFNTIVDMQKKNRHTWNKTDIASLDLQGPIFVHEPPYKIEFSNNTGGHIHCSGHANPYPEVIHIFIFFPRLSHFLYRR